MTLNDTNLPLEPAALSSSVAEPAGRNIADRLLAKFGPGEVPRATRVFYRKIEQVVFRHGDRAYQLVNAAVAQAADVERPANYFAKAIIGKFTALGWWNEPVPW